MPIIDSFKKLRELTDDELVELYDDTAKHTDFGLAFLRDELQHRENERQYDQMLAASNQMRFLTWFMAGLTLVNLVFVAIALFS